MTVSCGLVLVQGFWFRKFKKTVDAEVLISIKIQRFAILKMFNFLILLAIKFFFQKCYFCFDPKKKKKSYTDLIRNVCL